MTPPFRPPNPEGRLPERRDRLLECRHGRDSSPGAVPARHCGGRGRATGAHGSVRRLAHRRHRPLPDPLSAGAGFLGRGGGRPHRMDPRAGHRPGRLPVPRPHPGGPGRPRGGAQRPGGAPDPGPIRGALAHGTSQRLPSGHLPGQLDRGADGPRADPHPSPDPPRPPVGPARAHHLPVPPAPGPLGLEGPPVGQRGLRHPPGGAHHRFRPPQQRPAGGGAAPMGPGRANCRPTGT